MPRRSPCSSELHASEPALQLTDARNGTDGVEALWGNRLDILAL